MWSVLSAFGDVAFKTATKTGLVAGNEQPPYPCAWPLKKLAVDDDVAKVQAMCDANYAAVIEILNSPLWEIVNYTDPEAAEGGDLYLFGRPRIGAFNFAKATMSLLNCTPQNIIDIIHSESFDDRMKYSADMVKFEVIAKPTKNSQIQHCEYWAPPPVAGRDFCFLVSHHVDEEGTVYVVGCSVDYSECPKSKKRNIVRGSALWGWQMIPIGPNTLVSYVSTMNPRGWTPAFVIGWLKTEIAKELVGCRSLLYGKTFSVHKSELADLGISKEEIDLEYKRNSTGCKEVEDD